ncbi:hypothetical protein MRB53_010067 [Persea americana]|uniref:Uncharacterized protein n=1 Tax=Persea americana TaxID=3435 RepID=A0ACC2LR00_PERAE|nr:hypothetical protein MRB53_010067 [Persea americana]
MVVAGVSNCGKRISSSIYNNKKLSVILLSFLLIATQIATVSAISASRNNASHPTKSTTHTLLRSSCSSTRYPDLCFSSLAAAPSLSTSLATLKDVIEASLNITITAVDHAYFKIQKLIQRKGLTSREKTALNDCLEDVDQTLDELHMVEADLRKYPKMKSLSRHADDLKTLLSAAMTNQDSCIDGFSHDGADRKLRKELLKSLTRVHRLCGNALAMVRNMTDTDMANERTTRRLGEVVNGDGFPSWLSAGDRRLLQASTVTPNVVVAADGSGDFTTVSAAVAAAPESSSSRYVIKIKAGVYTENVEVPKKKTNLMFIGDGRTNTIITGSRNVVDGSTTFHSATVDEFFYSHHRLILQMRPTISSTSCKESGWDEVLSYDDRESCWREWQGATAT